MDIEKAKNRCNELVRVEHANWIGISNQEAIQTVLNELDKDNNIISDLQNEVTLKQCELDNKDKIINEIKNKLNEHIKFCEQEASGSLNNEICQISLKFDKSLLDISESRG